MSGRSLLLSANWKMNGTHLEAIRYVGQLAALLRVSGMPEGREATLHPPFTAIRSAQTALESDGVPVALGAQNCYTEDHGAFTGEVSALMLAKLGVSYVIAGHSERRTLMGEDDALVRAKLDAIWREKMTPILCVGEHLAERQAGEAQARVTAELEAALGGRPAAAFEALVVAYEPVWAIGTGETATPDDAQELCAVIRTVIARLGGAAAAEAVRIQYGGSATPENAASLLTCPDVDGLLVGGASLEAERFVAIVRAGS